MSDPAAKRRVRLWIRLLGVTRRTEAELREFLRLRHATTLPRFDVLAALYRHAGGQSGDGVTMSDLSRMLLVSNGNATTVVDRLERDGLVRRTPSDTDRRIVHASLTPEGLGAFEVLAAEHEVEVNRLFADLTEADLDQMTELLKRMGGLR